MATETTFIQFAEGSAPSTPASTKWRVYFKTDGIYVIDDAGNETGPLAEAGGAATFVGAAVTHNAAQNLNNGSTTTLAFNTEEYDTDTFHDTATNNSRLTVPTGKAGYYVATAMIAFTASANGDYRSVRVMKNGTDIVAIHTAGEAGLSAASAIVPVTTRPLSLAEADYLECVVVVNGASLQALSSAEYSPRFSMYRVG